MAIIAVQSDCIIPLVIGIETIMFKTIIEEAIHFGTINKRQHDPLGGKFNSNYFTVNNDILLEIIYQLPQSHANDLKVIFHHQGKTKTVWYRIPWLASTVAYDQRLIVELFKRIAADLVIFIQGV